MAIFYELYDGLNNPCGYSYSSLTKARWAVQALKYLEGKQCTVHQITVASDGSVNEINLG